jgi:hypothetical protein
MTSSHVFRLSGLALLVGAVLAVISTIGSGVLFPDMSDTAAATNPLNVLLSTVGVIGAVCALLGLPGLYARSAGEGGWTWLAGVALIAVTGMLFGVFMGLMGVLVFPVLATRAPDLFREGPPPSFLVLFIVGTVANILGAALLAVAVLRKALYARWCGYLLVLEALLAALSFLISGPSSSPLAAIMNIISPLPLFIFIGWAGYLLWSGREPAARALTPAVAAA